MGEAEDAERERRREKKREKKRQAKLIDVNVSEQDVDAALAQGERAKTEEESDAVEGKKKSKKQRMEKREKQEQEKQKAEEEGNPQEAFSSQKRFLDQRSAGTGLLPHSRSKQPRTIALSSQTATSSPTALASSRATHLLAARSHLWLPVAVNAKKQSGAPCRRDLLLTG
jgi:hypothetical protein